MSKRCYCFPSQIVFINAKKSIEGVESSSVTAIPFVGLLVIPEKLGEGGGQFRKGPFCP